MIKQAFFNPNAILMKNIHVIFIIPVYTGLRPLIWAPPPHYTTRAKRPLFSGENFPQGILFVEEIQNLILLLPKLII
jgi:hypothetical protein